MTLTADVLTTYTRTGPALVQLERQIDTAAWSKPFSRDCYVTGPDARLETWASVTVAANGTGMVMAEFQHPDNSGCPHRIHQYVGLEHAGRLHLFDTACADSNVPLARLFAQRTTITPTFLRLPVLPNGHAWAWCLNPAEVPAEFVSFTAAPFTQVDTETGKTLLESARYYLVRNAKRSIIPGSLWILFAGVTVGDVIAIAYGVQLWFWGGLTLLGLTTTAIEKSDALPRLFQKPQIALELAIRHIRMLLVANDRKMLVPELEVAMQQRFAGKKLQCTARTVRRALHAMIKESELSVDSYQFLDPQQQLIYIPIVALVNAPGGGQGRRRESVEARSLPDLAPMPVRV